MKDLIELENFLEYKLKNKYKILFSYLLVSVIVFFAIYASISSFINDLDLTTSSKLKLKVTISTFPIFFSFAYWLNKFNIIKIFKNNKNVVLFSISCENQKLTERLDDIINNINKLLISTSLNHKIEIIKLNTPAAISFKNFIKQLHKYDNSNSQFLEYLKKIERKLIRIKCRMAIVGEFKERDAPSNYYLNTDAIIVNQSIGNHQDIQQKLQIDLTQLLKLELKINSCNETDDLAKSSNQIYYSIIYIMGLVMMIENNYEDSLRIWQLILSNINKSEMSAKKSELVVLEANTNLIISRYLFYNGEYKKSMEHREMFLKSFPNEYASLIIKSILLVEYDNDYKEALSTIIKASRLVGDRDKTWKYNKLYILLKLMRYNEAKILFDDIISYTSTNEVDIVDQVLSYNHKKINNVIIDDSNLINILLYGLFQFHKNQNLSEACQYIELFIENDNSRNFQDFYIHAKQVEDLILNQIGYAK